MYIVEDDMKNVDKTEYIVLICAHGGGTDILDQILLDMPLGWSDF